MTSLICAFLLLFTAHDDNTLAVSSIPPELFKNANAVVRYDITKYDIVEVDKLSMQKKVAITILNGKSKFLSDVHIQYQAEVDKIKDLQIEVFDAEGRSIKKIKKKEISDITLSDGYSLAGDRRAKVFRYTSNDYPYTITYSYTKKSKNTLFLRPWFPLGWSNVSVQDSRYQIETSVSDLDINAYVYIDHPDKYQLDTVTHTYSASNIGAVSSKPLSPKASTWLPNIRFLPSHFYFHGYSGSFDDWSGYGQWMYDNMLADRGSLPDLLLEEIDALVEGATSDDEIARILYAYVTGSTRYVSVQLGIGGLKPFSCGDVYELKYGDCKALSFYLHNLLQHYEVKSIYTEIEHDLSHNVDYDPVRPGLDQGNHIILCLPMDGDTVWLECTSKYTLYGYTHSGINDRQALLISSNGGQLAKTTKYNAQENLSKIDATIEITDSKNILTKLIGYHSKLRHEDYLGIIMSTDSKRSDRIRKSFERIPNINVKAYDLKLDSTSHTAIENAEIEMISHLETAGPYMMVPIDIGKIKIPKKIDQDRSQSIYIKDATMDLHDIAIIIPEGYSALLDDVELITFSNEFGAINFDLDQSEEKVTVSVSVTRNAGVFAANKVTAYNDFVDQVKQALSTKVILKPIK